MTEELSKFLSVELTEFNIGLKNSLKTSVEKYEDVLDFVFEAKGKQIRPIFGILISRMLGEFSHSQNVFLQAIELIHNATLFHDDIIDEADIRRNRAALNKEFSNKIAVLSGDYFLTCAIKNICSLNDSEIISLVANYMKEICEGEIEQNITLNEIPSLEEYLDKTKRKTALLFSLTMQGIGLLSQNPEFAPALKTFGEFVGMIYQLQDDIKNFLEYNDKPVLNDLKSGVITTPIIFLSQENKEIKKLILEKNYDEIFSLLQKSDAIEKSKQLIKDCYDKAQTISKDFPENNYKEYLLKLLAQLCK